MAGESLHIKGDVIASEDLHFEGRVDGTISAPGHVLVVGAGAVINAKVDARAIVVAGTLVGDAVARERIELQATGVLEGKLDARTMVVREGAMLRAQVTMPDRSAAKKASPAA
jgi:cytoskeletal protein CcmA (bactofilin family)